MGRLVLVAIWLCIAVNGRAEPLPKTKPLTRDGDLAMQMVEGIDKYLMLDLAASPARRNAFWKPDFSSPDAYAKSVEPNRQRLRKILGVVDERVSFKDLNFVGGPKVPSLVAETDAYKIHAVRWPALPGVDGEGLLLEPRGKVLANVVALPDADWTPEMFVGLAPGVPKESQFARRLAEMGCRVIVPVLIDRGDEFSGNARLGRLTNQPHREFIYRMAYEMGRHIIGYEVQKVLAAVDWFTSQNKDLPVGVIGVKEGSIIALAAGAIDQRITATNAEYAGGDVGVQALDRNRWDYLAEFGDARLATLVLPRAIALNLELSSPRKPPPTPPGRAGAAPPGQYPKALTETIKATDVDDELKRNPFRDKLIGWLPVEKGNEYAARAGTLVEALGVHAGQFADTREVAHDARKFFDPAPRQHRQFDQLVAFTQKLMRDSEARRAETFWAKLDTSTPEKYAASTAPLRKQLWEEVIGKLPAPTLAMNPQSRLIYDEPKWTGHEVTLDLYPDVFAYGILLLPKDLKPGEKRPVVVCQHGLEGRPQDVCNPKMDTRAYHSFGAKLADKGYIVFAPQNPYIGGDKFRVLQRKANPLGLSIFSFIVRQHERILDWLATVPNVDAEKIAFYGLSYGGKTAMRVPAILPRYCLSICSGDFNEWIWKNVSVDYRGSYMFSGEYEMPEFNLGHTFGYAEMAALIAPRPFMVERGHNDSVGIDEWVAYEYAKVRRHYSRLKLSDKTEIEYFDGPHEIHGVGTFRFLEKHLGR